MSNIKDDTLAQVVEVGGVSTMTIKRFKDDSNTTKLSDVLEYLPHGIVAKEETGMGATYLELHSQRTSIVVEPIKYTASSKAVHTNNSLYVGSPTKLRGRVSDKAIKAYWTDKTIQYKKLIVVADSLPRVVEAIGEDVYRDAFLMIDEIDSFQTDASFRSKMEDCLDIYKRFPIENRAMVSATPLAFTDPELLGETRTIIRYNQQQPRSIDLYCTIDINAVGYEKILAKLQQYPDDKLMVAYNSVSGCRTLADELVSKKILQMDDIKILCSVNSQNEVHEYYTELDSDMLPGKVNFVTSAYFTGFDLKERYHLISISGSKNLIYALSDNRLKQIAGRCRVGLLSETVVYDTVPPYADLRPFSADDMIAAAKKEIEAIRCIEKTYAGNELLRENLEKVRTLIIKHTVKHQSQYVRQAKDGLNISYLNIDAYMESVRVRKTLYLDPFMLLAKLKEAGHTVKHDWQEPEHVIENKDTAKKLKQQQVQEIVSIIRVNETDLKLLLKSKKLSLVQRNIVRAYLDNHEYIETNKLLSILEQSGGYSDSRWLNNMVFAAFYASLPNDELYKRNVSFHIPTGKGFTKKDLLANWNSILLESGLHQKLVSPVKAVRLTKLHYKTKKEKSGLFHIVSDHPIASYVIKRRKAVTNQNQLSNLITAVK